MSLWANGWLKGAAHQPGAHAGYRAGRFRIEGGVVHYTVGVDSTGIGLRGVFPFLLPKSGPPKQFSPVDAVNYHACEWNRRLVGVETEKLNDGEATTNDQIEGWALIAAGLAELGIAYAYYDGARVPIGAALPAPYLSHRSLVHRACDQHSDYLPASDMEQIFARARQIGAPAAPTLPSLEGIEMSKIGTWIDKGGAWHSVRVNDNGGVRDNWQGPPVAGKWSKATDIIATGAKPGGHIGVLEDFYEPGRVDLFIEHADPDKQLHVWQSYGGNKTGPKWGSEVIG